MLLVDKEAITLELMASVIDAAGYKSDKCTSSKMAIKLIERRIK